MHPPRNANTLLQRDDIDITIVSTAVKSSLCAMTGLAATREETGNAIARVGRREREG